MKPFELICIHHHIAIVHDGDYYYCDGHYTEYRTKEEALAVIKPHSSPFLVSDDEMKELMELSYLRKETKWNEEGMKSEVWKKVLGDEKVIFHKDGTFSSEGTFTKEELSCFQRIVSKFLV